MDMGSPPCSPQMPIFISGLHFAFKNCFKSLLWSRILPTSQLDLLSDQHLNNSNDSENSENLVARPRVFATLISSPTPSSSRVTKGSCSMIPLAWKRPRKRSSYSLAKQKPSLKDPKNISLAASTYTHIYNHVFLICICISSFIQSIDLLVCLFVYLFFKPYRSMILYTVVWWIIIVSIYYLSIHLLLTCLCIDLFIST